MSRRISFSTCVPVVPTKEKIDTNDIQEIEVLASETDDLDPIQFRTRGEQPEEEEETEEGDEEEDEEDREPWTVSSVWGYFCVCQKSSPGDYTIRVFNIDDPSPIANNPLLEKQFSASPVKSLVFEERSACAFIATTDSIEQIELFQSQRQSRAVSVPGGVKEIQVSNVGPVIWALSEEGHLFGWNFETNDHHLLAKDVSAFCIDCFSCVWFVVDDRLFKHDETNNSTDEVCGLCEGVFSVRNVMRDWIVCISACDDKLYFTLCARLSGKTPEVATWCLSDGVSTDDGSKWVVASHPELDVLLVSYGPDSDLFVLEIMDQNGTSLLKKLDLSGQTLRGKWESYSSCDWKPYAQVGIVSKPELNRGVVFGYRGKHVWERLSMTGCRVVSCKKGASPFTPPLWNVLTVKSFGECSIMEIQVGKGRVVNAFMRCPGYPILDMTCSIDDHLLFILAKDYNVLVWRCYPPQFLGVSYLRCEACEQGTPKIAYSDLRGELRITQNGKCMRFKKPASWVGHHSLELIGIEELESPVACGSLSELQKKVEELEQRKKKLNAVADNGAKITERLKKIIAMADTLGSAKLEGVLPEQQEETGSSDNELLMEKCRSVIKSLEDRIAVCGKRMGGGAYMSVSFIKS